MDHALALEPQLLFQVLSDSRDPPVASHETIFKTDPQDIEDSKNRQVILL